MSRGLLWVGVIAAILPAFSIGDDASFAIDRIVRGESNRYLAHQNPWSERALGLEEISRQIRSNAFHTAEEFLLYLKEREPAFFEDVVLVHHSLSSQRDAVSAEFPRVIAHKDRLTIAMVTDPKHPKYRQFELIETSPETGAETFSRITFPAKGETEAVRIEGGESCTRCHGETPRKIWQTYPLWTGTFGADHDRLPFFYPRKPGKEVTRGEEGMVFENYSAIWKTNPRLYLFSRLGDGGHFPFENNLAGEHFSQLNAIRIVHDLQKSPAYPFYKYALYAAFVGCSNIPDYLPRSVIARHEKRLGMNFEALTKDTRRVNADRYHERLEGFFAQNKIDTSRYVRTYNGQPDGLDNLYPQYIAAWRYLVDGQDLDESWDFRKWSLDFDPRPGHRNYSFDFSNGSDLGQLPSWVVTVYGRRVQKDPDLAGPQACDDLMAKSRRALSAR